MNLTLGTIVLGTVTVLFGFYVFKNLISERLATRKCTCDPYHWDRQCPPPKPTEFGTGESVPFWQNVQLTYQLTHAQLKRLHLELEELAIEIEESIPALPSPGKSEQIEIQIPLEHPKVQRLIKNIKATV